MFCGHGSNACYGQNRELRVSCERGPGGGGGGESGGGGRGGGVGLGVLDIFGGLEL